MADVGVFLPSLRGGGAERVMLNLAIGFLDRGLTVDLVLVNAEGPYLSEVPPGIRLVDLRSRRTLSALLPLSRYLRQDPPSALLSAMDHTNAVAFMARKLAGVDTRSVGTIHTTISESVSRANNLRHRLSPLWIRALYPLGDHLVAVSSGVAADFLRTAGRRSPSVSVIPNPVITRNVRVKAGQAIEHPWFARDDVPVLLSVGRLARPKGLNCLLEAFRLVRAERAARLIILGDGPERGPLERLADALGVSADLDMPGFLENPYKFMANADVFVLSSEWEGLPTALIEALALGTRVVATDCPSGPSEILGTDSPWLVPVGDPHALASAINRRLDSQEPPASHLSPYTVEEAVERYLEVLEIAPRV